jgi:hypothetical protein
MIIQRISMQPSLTGGARSPTFLPERYQIAKARVLDANDEISEQIDLVIFDRQYCSLWLKGEGASHYIPAESVYAASEVKQDLNKENMKAASTRWSRYASSIARVHRWFTPAGGSRKPRSRSRSSAGFSPAGVIGRLRP